MGWGKAIVFVTLIYILGKILTHDKHAVDNLGFSSKSCRLCLEFVEVKLAIQWWKIVGRIKGKQHIYWIQTLYDTSGWGTRSTHDTLHGNGDGRVVGKLVNLSCITNHHCISTNYFFQQLHWPEHHSMHIWVHQSCAYHIISDVSLCFLHSVYIWILYLFNKWPSLDRLYWSAIATYKNAFHH